LSGGLFGAAGIAGGAWSPERFLAHAGAGCVSGAVGDGGCGRGAASAVAGKFATNFSDGNFIATIVAGGTVSVIGGGKFSNGALTASFGYLYNYCSSVGDCAKGFLGRTIGGSWLAPPIIWGAGSTAIDGIGGAVDYLNAKEHALKTEENMRKFEDLYNKTKDPKIAAEFKRIHDYYYQVAVPEVAKPLMSVNDAIKQKVFERAIEKLMFKSPISAN
jgi:hypothetical protein